MSGSEKLGNAVSYESYGEFFGAFRNLAAQYSDLPGDSVFSAWMRASMAANPYMQNRRVKNISSLPADYGKDDIARMIVAPEGNEQPLRRTAHALEWSAYPYRKIRYTYQALNTFRYYACPAYLPEGEAGKPEFEREAVFVDKLNFALKPDQWAHQIAGQALQEGKVAYVPRVAADKSHNCIKWAFMQQLPSDWWKIIGFNSLSKYTVSFNMMYFLQPGTDWRQFGDLFEPYIADFAGILEPTTPRSRKIAYAARNTVCNAQGRTFKVNLEKFRDMQPAAGDPKLYNQNGKWAYWVTLPAEKCWVFEIDDTNTVAAPAFTGLFLAMDQLSAYERVQLEIVQNPLVSVALGEIPYMDKNEPGKEDAYQLSPAGRNMFLSYWYDMLSAANTGGIGAYFAPVKNLHMETLSEAPNATEISTRAYAYTVEKSGLSGLIPVTDEPRAGSVTISAELEERFCFCIYRQMENMMNEIYRSMKLRNEWRFVMFGGFLSDEKALKSAREGMERGILSDTYVYLALKGRSVMGDLAMSRAIKDSGIMDMRLPLVSMYSMKQDGSAGQSAAMGENKAGRPSKSLGDIGGEGIGDGQEDDLDNQEGGSGYGD